MTLLGLNAYHGDASAAALVDGELVAAAEEERFTRVKHAAGFPQRAIGYVAGVAGLANGRKLLVAVARDPRARLGAKALYALRAPALLRRRFGAQSRFATIARDVACALGVAAELIEVRRVEHHTAHMASAFFASPFEKAALFSVDGLGDFASCSWGVGEGTKIGRLGAITFPHSLGIFYTALTQYLGFDRYGEEYKVMGLASYGEPEYLDGLRGVVHASRNGEVGFALDLDCFRHHRGAVEMTWGEGEPVIGTLYSPELVRRFGRERRPDEPIERRHENFAASLQARLEEVVLEQLAILHRRTGLRQLCLAGGVANNCVANGKILERTGFEEVYVPPAAGDAGLAIGAALHVWHHEMGMPRRFVMDHAYWGPEFSAEAAGAALRARGVELERAGCAPRRIDDEEELCRFTAARIAEAKVVGWFHGRMEWGPRALGNRSILADPRRADMRDVLNVKIKKRERFRPFAPSILEEAGGEYFEQSYPSPFMLMAYRVRPEKRAAIPATTHVDGTGRLQTVNERQNRLYYRLIREFRRQTGVPVLLNTSFNENEPVVCEPDEAIDCFLRTKMDLLVMGPWVLERDGGSRP